MKGWKDERMKGWRNKKNETMNKRINKWNDKQMKRLKNKLYRDVSTLFWDLNFMVSHYSVGTCKYVGLELYEWMHESTWYQRSLADSYTDNLRNLPNTRLQTNVL